MKNDEFQKRIKSIRKNKFDEAELEKRMNGAKNIDRTKFSIQYYIEKELLRISIEKKKIPRNTKDSRLTHKRATLSGNVIALSKLKQKLLNIKS